MMRVREALPKEKRASHINMTVLPKDLTGSTLRGRELEVPQNFIFEYGYFETGPLKAPVAGEAELRVFPSRTHACVMCTKGPCGVNGVILGHVVDWSPPELGRILFVPGQQGS